jgi:YidC/Oxa1 family membrane protein insertase
MNKFEIIVVALLCMLLFAVTYRQSVNKPEPASGGNLVNGAETVEQSPLSATGKTQVISSPAADPAPAAQQLSFSENDDSTAAAARAPEKILTLSNEQMEVDVSSYGASIVKVRLLEYKETQAEDSGPVLMDFSSAASLRMAGIPWLSTNAAYNIEPISSTSVVAGITAPNGVSMTRTITLGSDYRMRVSDVFSNSAATVISLPSHYLAAGAMHFVPDKSDVSGVAYISADSLPISPKPVVTHWSEKDSVSNGLAILDLFTEPSRRGGCSFFHPAMTRPMPVNVQHESSVPIEWIAFKNKYFLQVLLPDVGGAGCVINASRIVGENENPSDPRSWNQSPAITKIDGGAVFAAAVLEPGQSVTRNVTYYAGPKKHAVVHTLGKECGEIMEFGFLSPLSRGLLWLMNFFYSIFSNYGVAIILMTMVVKLIFWPLTHKSAESMRKMQALQPEVTALREKFKDNPQRLNKEVMLMYKEKKVNPMAGCLPLVVQIPVFIALFNTLRSAVELRFASFLWIRDLSVQEGLLADVLPVPINILPIFMTGMTIIQQKMTPQMGDPAQAKMMTYMPIIFLFLFYTMPSGLVLYWTVSQMGAIVGMWWSKHRRERLPVPAKA